MPAAVMIFRAASGFDATEMLYPQPAVSYFPGVFSIVAFKPFFLSRSRPRMAWVIELTIIRFAPTSICLPFFLSDSVQYIQ